MRSGTFQALTVPSLQPDRPSCSDLCDSETVGPVLHLEGSAEVVEDGVRLDVAGRLVEAANIGQELKAGHQFVTPDPSQNPAGCSSWTSTRNQDRNAIWPLSANRSLSGSIRNCERIPMSSLAKLPT